MDSVFYLGEIVQGIMFVLILIVLIVNFDSIKNDL